VNRTASHARNCSAGRAARCERWKPRPNGRRNRPIDCPL